MPHIDNRRKPAATALVLVLGTLALAACGGSSTSNTVASASTRDHGRRSRRTLCRRARMPAEERHRVALTHSRPATPAGCRPPPQWTRRSTVAQGRDARTVRSRAEEVRRQYLPWLPWRRRSLQQPSVQTGALEVRGMHARKRREPAGAKHLGQRTDLQQQSSEHEQRPVPQCAGQMPAHPLRGARAGRSGIRRSPRWVTRRWPARRRLSPPAPIGRESALDPERAGRWRPVRPAHRVHAVT